MDLENNGNDAAGFELRLPDAAILRAASFLQHVPTLALPPAFILGFKSASVESRTCSRICNQPITPPSNSGCGPAAFPSENSKFGGVPILLVVRPQQAPLEGAFQRGIDGFAHRTLGREARTTKRIRTT